jgi:uncharacterized protein (DUF1501 family)
MLQIDARNLGPRCAGMSRRDFVRVGALGTLGLTLPDLLKLKAQGATTEGKAKSVIQLWMWGGPTHLDTFDPKPEAGEDYCGALKNPIETKAAGMRICELLPLLAKQGDKFSILRGFTSQTGDHFAATYMVQTGIPTSQQFGSPETKQVGYPSIGSVVALKKGYEAGYKGALPPYVILPSGGWWIGASGFLGHKYEPYAAGGDPNQKGFMAQGMNLASGITPERSQGRRALLQDVDSLAKELDKEKLFDKMDSFQQKAYGLVLGDAKQAYDLSQEKDELRDRYGRNHFGQSCLLARRLVERGVPFVTINWGGWDHHVDCIGAMKSMLPILDPAFATLLEDLHQRGLLDSTIVYWTGEFGRTPKLQGGEWKGGRHHWPDPTPCVVAGGGFRGGAVVGASDEKGETIKDRKVYPWDLTSSIYKLLGIDYMGKLPHPQDCGVAYISPLATGQVPSGGILTEIM